MMANECIVTLGWVLAEQTDKVRTARTEIPSKFGRVPDTRMRLAQSIIAWITFSNHVFEAHAHTHTHMHVYTV